MPYRSERFEVGELEGLGQVFEAIDALEAQGLTVEGEIMAGTSHRRTLHPDTIEAGMSPNYLLQTTLTLPPLVEGFVYFNGFYISKARRLLLGMVLPGEVVIDRGGLRGYDATAQHHALGSTGDTHQDITEVYPPWLKASWQEHGKLLLFYCGILPPQPKHMNDEHMCDWDTRLMRSGRVVFSATPAELVTA